MDPCLVISPHFDDAVLSVGQFLMSWPGAHVLTVFTGSPRPPVTTTFDEHGGFADSTEAMRARWVEDDRALSTLGARGLALGFLDNAYRPEGDRPDPMLIGQEIMAYASALGAVKILGPLGLLHPDHEIVAEAMLYPAVRFEREVWFYEDIPTRVTHPELVRPALDRIEAATGRTTELGFLGTSDVDIKQNAVRCYESQMWALDPNLLYVPERTWRLL